MKSFRPATILVRTFGTFCISCKENAIQVNPRLPLESVGCYRSNTLYIPCTRYGPQLYSGGGGEILLRPCL